MPSSSGYTAKVETQIPQQTRLPSQYNTATSSQAYYYNESSSVASYSQPKANSTAYTSTMHPSVPNPAMATQPVASESSSYQAHKLYHPSNFNAKPVQQVQSASQVTNNSVSTKIKRESPLDLSVKTVRTSADSTLDDSDVQERKFVPSRPQVQTTVNYPTYDLYANSFQRNMTKTTTVGAPKVDFLPNFNVPSLNQNMAIKVESRRPAVHPSMHQHYQQHSPAVPTSAHMATTSPKKPSQGLPRIDFPTLNRNAYNAVSNEVMRKRPAEPTPPVVPSKIQKVDVWRQTIDQQIEQRLSSYAKSRMQEQPQQLASIKPVVVNGHYPQVSQDQTKAAYPSSYPRSQYNYPPSTHNQTYVPTAMAHHQYPGHAISHSSQQQQQVQYSQHPLQRTNSNPSLPVGANRGNLGGGADRRVLSLLRNSLEIKGAKEAQKKLEQEQQHVRSDVQQPSTDVMAPLQPKPSVVGRHNMSPFAATSLFERNSNTPPTYKFHLPKAVDSFKFESDVPKDNNRMPPMESKHSDFTITNTNPTGDLDGLAAYLAARIRTKAELKQVGPATQSVHPEIKQETSPLHNNSASTNKSSSGGSPPKLTRERTPSFAPRRRLFSKADEDGALQPNAPPRDKSGLRSSSETSVFDFPDTDSENEMPVLERQSLEDMRRDRKTTVKPAIPEEPLVLNPASPLDPFFDEACDKFMEQLKSGTGKKRGRRKRVVEPEVIAKLESVAKEQPIGVKDDQEEIEADAKEAEAVAKDIEPDLKEIEADSKKIGPDSKEIETDGKEEEVTIKEEIKTEVDSDSDSDVPLIKCKSKPIKIEEPLEFTPPKLKQEPESESDSESETIKDLSEKLKVKKALELDIRADLTPAKKVDDRLKKPTFGDGTDFHPGWEEEVFNYKRSLRMPTTLISVTRPPRFHRMSTSLPDLDSCPTSPSPSDNIKIKSETLDSDMDSNSNFSFSFNKLNYDSEEGSSSVKSLNISDSKPKSNSILDRLMERCSKRKRRKYKKKEEEETPPTVPKIMQKPENTMELLPTPGLEIKVEAHGKKKKLQALIKGESVFLGFRKKTIENFKEAFMSSSNSIACVNEQFKTVVMNSRTRKQARVLKQKATIKEVFGEDRPASAPPVTCVDNNDDTKLNITFTKDGAKNTSFFESTKEALKNKLLNRGSKTSENLMKSIVSKKILSELPDDIIDIKREPDSKSETPSIDGDDYSTPAGKKKMKNIRRKFSSGFDYIRKKKKQIKKEGVDNAEPGGKPKRRGLLLKTTPENVQDIQKEIKMWVMNKGIGETHLHRSARLGYTVS